MRCFAVFPEHPQYGTYSGQAVEMSPDRGDVVGFPVGFSGWVRFTVATSGSSIRVYRTDGVMRPPQTFGQL